jgi:hypothetical protein
MIGDVHGEIDALDALLGRLGVRGTRSDRGLVFVGDLIDRGPDSPAVVRRVRELVDAGVAWVVAGNHELNLLAGEQKEGNGWFLGHEDRIHHEDGSHGSCFDSAPVRAEHRDGFLRFFNDLPLMLHRADLRVVHACDHAASHALLPEHAPIAHLSHEHRRRIDRLLDERGENDRERRGMAHQNENPVKVLTSGLEHPLPPGVTFFAGGKHRTVTRSRWWLDTGASVPTVVGHYWRRRAGHVDAAKMDVWDDQPAFAWSRNVFCVDYSVGRRFAERAEGRTSGFHGGLAAMLWPERLLAWDDSDEQTPTTGLELVSAES